MKLVDSIPMIILFVTLVSLFYFLNYIKNKEDKLKREYLYSIKKFLVSENTKINFTKNEIHINEDYDTNFKVVAYEYMQHKDLLKRYCIEQKINSLFIQPNISFKDLIYITDVILDKK